MLVFVDESGDVGLKEASSKYFHVVLVVFPDREEAQRCDSRINTLRAELGFPPEVELKFNRLSRSKRISIIERVAHDNWFFWAITINKAQLYGEGFRFSGSFYKYVTRLVFTNASSYLLDAKVVIDGRGSRRFRQELAAYLRRQVNVERSHHISTVKLQDSRKNNLLQLADLVVGALGRRYRIGKSDRNDYWQLIRHRCIHHQFWPQSK